MNRPRLTDFVHVESAFYRSGLSLRREENDASVSWQGTYRTPLGIVEVFTYFQKRNGEASTNLRLIHAGRDHFRYWPCRWGDQTIARLARELAEEVTGGAA
jgi:hypothetical protein